MCLLRPVVDEIGPIDHSQEAGVHRLGRKSDPLHEILIGMMLGAVENELSRHYEQLGYAARKPTRW